MTVLVPSVLSDALSMLRDHPGATVLAGGTDLLVEVNSGHRVLDVVMAVDRVAELRTWSVDAEGRNLRIGAGVPYRTIVESPIAELAPALAEASRTVGSPQIRQTGTLGGNLGTSSPAGDTLPVLSALGATIELQSTSGERLLPLEEFMVGVKRNARRPDELITAVNVPVCSGWQGYSKVGVRNAMVIATASSCLVADATSQTIRVALGSVGPVVIRCTDAERWVSAHVDWVARRVSQEAVNTFAQKCAEAARPIDDHRSTAAYRRHAVSVLTARQLRRAFPDG